MDKIRIEIVRGCDEGGNGGAVADDAAVILGPGLLDGLCEAFAQAYGLHAIQPDDPQEAPVPVTPERNVAYRLRMFAQEILTAHVGRVAAQTAAAEAAKQMAESLATLKIQES